MSAPTSLKPGELLKKCCVTETLSQLEAEALEKTIVAWMAENPDIDGEIVYQKGQPPMIREREKAGVLMEGDPVKAGETVRVPVGTLDCSPGPIMRIRSTPKALFAQLREMGVGCESCRRSLDVDRIEDYCEECEPGYLCNRWKGT